MRPIGPHFLCVVVLMGISDNSEMCVLMQALLRDTGALLRCFWFGGSYWEKQPLGALVARTFSVMLMNWRRFLLACLCFFAPFSGTTWAQSMRWPLDWGSWDRASGDWGGFRTKLNNMGIDPELNYAHDILANPVGGERQSAAYAGSLIGGIDFDLDQLFGLNGTKFSFGFYQGLGRSLSGEDINNVFDVAQIFIGDVFGISQMNFFSDTCG